MFLLVKWTLSIYFVIIAIKTLPHLGPELADGFPVSSNKLKRHRGPIVLLLCCWSGLNSHAQNIPCEKNTNTRCENTRNQKPQSGRASLPNAVRVLKKKTPSRPSARTQTMGTFSKWILDKQCWLVIPPLVFIIHIGTRPNGTAALQREPPL